MNNEKIGILLGLSYPLFVTMIILAVYIIILSAKNAKSKGTSIFFNIFKSTFFNIVLILGLTSFIEAIMGIHSDSIGES